jgi:KaiC/GvpD/RAD55 family RecA-like ATPase
LLGGGLPFGGMVLLSAKSGSGKSTLASQILINAVEQGYKCLAYSGELSNDRFKAWLDYQVAGKHVQEYSNKWGDTLYKISDANRELIEAWYRDKIFLYDNSYIPEDDEQEVKLVELIVNMIMQYGVKVILLDNLMTAMGLENMSGADKYDMQDKFGRKLARVALRYNVLILLVVHKRKNNYSTDENDEVMGSSTIPNLATVIMSYDRNNEIEVGQRLLKVSKNRLFGRVELKGYVLDYDPKSKRIYGKGDTLYTEYGWRKLEVPDGFLTIDDDEITPFDTED